MVFGLTGRQQRDCSGLISGRVSNCLPLDVGRLKAEFEAGVIKAAHVLPALPL